MAGMVGSRNGWVEAPYLECPVEIDDLGRSFARADLGGGREALIVPGLTCRRRRAARPTSCAGEETKIAGGGVRDGVVLTPGTHPNGPQVARAGSRASPPS